MKVLSKEPKSNSGGLKAARTSWAPRQSYNLTMGFYQWTTGPRQKKAGVNKHLDCRKIWDLLKPGTRQPAGTLFYLTIPNPAPSAPNPWRLSGLHGGCTNSISKPNLCKPFLNLKKWILIKCRPAAGF